MKAVSVLVKKRPHTTIILSGAKQSSYYNEPKDMYRALKQAEINSAHILLDSSGNNTFESINNFVKLGLGDSLIIVTQKFHAYRAILICRYLNIESKVYEAEAVSVDVTNRPVLREVLARFAAFFQFYLFKI
jgi:SanA protein